MLAALGAKKRPGQVLVGFTADESGRGVSRAREKLDRKKADIFVFNDISRADIGFDSPENEVTLIMSSDERVVAKAPKDEIAAAVLDAVEHLLP